MYMKTIQLPALVFFGTDRTFAEESGEIEHTSTTDLATYLSWQKSSG